MKNTTQTAPRKLYRVTYSNSEDQRPIISHRMNITTARKIIRNYRRDWLAKGWDVHKFVNNGYYVIPVKGMSIFVEFNEEA